MVIGFVWEVRTPTEIDAGPPARTQKDVEQFVSFDFTQSRLPEQKSSTKHSFVFSQQSGAHQWHMVATQAGPDDAARWATAQAGPDEHVGVNDDRHSERIASGGIFATIVGFCRQNGRFASEAIPVRGQLQRRTYYRAWSFVRPHRWLAGGTFVLRILGFLKVSKTCPRFIEATDCSRACVLNRSHSSLNATPRERLIHIVSMIDGRGLPSRKPIVLPSSSSDPTSSRANPSKVSVS